MTRSLSIAIGLARVWTRAYTSALDPQVRDERRAEIESDLWESHEDARRNGRSPHAAALHIAARVLLGIPHDVLWCTEHWRPSVTPMLRVAMITAVALFLILFWMTSVLENTPLPPPPSPAMAFIAAPPPPPPPPPPLPGSVVGKDGRVVRPPAAPSR